MPGQGGGLVAFSVRGPSPGALHATPGQPALDAEKVLPVRFRPSSGTPCPARSPFRLDFFKIVVKTFGARAPFSSGLMLPKPITAQS